MLRGRLNVKLQTQNLFRSPFVRLVLARFWYYLVTRALNLSSNIANSITIANVAVITETNLIVEKSIIIIRQIDCGVYGRRNLQRIRERILFEPLMLRRMKMKIDVQTLWRGSVEYPLTVNRISSASRTGNGNGSGNLRSRRWFALIMAEDR